SRLNLVRQENFWIEQLKNTHIFWDKVLIVMEKFAESRCLLAQSKNRKGKTEQNFDNLTTTDTFCGKNLGTDMRNFPSINLDLSYSRLNLVRQENSWIEELENTQIFWNEIISMMEKFAKYRCLSAKGRNGKGKTEENSDSEKNLGAGMKNFPSINLDLSSSRLNLVRQENSWIEELENTQILWNEIVDVMEKFAESRYLSVEGRNGKGKTEENYDNLTTTDTFYEKNFPSINIDFHSSRLNLVKQENFWVEELENTQIFWNETLAVIEKFAKYRCLSAKGRNGKVKTEENFDNFTTTETFFGKNLGADMKNFPSINLDFPSYRLNLVKQKNFWVEQLKNTELFRDKVLVVMEKFAKYRCLLVEGRNGKVKTEENFDNLTTTETFCRKNLGADMRNVPSINIDFLSSRLNLVRQENFWVEQLENTQIFWNEIVDVMEKFAASIVLSAQSKNLKVKTEEKFDNLITTETFCSKNLGADMRNFPPINLDFSSSRLNLLRQENFWDEELENTENFRDKVLVVMEKFAKYRCLSVEGRNEKEKTEQKFDSFTTTETFRGKNLGADMRNFPSINLDFPSSRLNLLKDRNLLVEQLENDDIYWDEIVSIEPVGEKQVYDLTIPETHNFVANDICLHNTSFAVNIGHSIAANLKLPVAIFSLEMSKEQLVLRLLASEARIESNRLRSGRISQSEWEPLTSAIGTLAEMPIFIDDTANITVNEIRSKVRQLQSEQGGALGLILLDYLQLMESSSSDNRVQELAKITRSLKGLARELSVPIIALSQLSRSVESRTNKRPMMSDLRESGCLTGDTLICLADGKKIPISRLVGKSNFSVLALNENTGKFESAIVSRVFSTGVKPIFSLQTSSGKLIRATANHPFFSMGGWKQLNTLNIGDSLAILNPKMLKYSILYCGQVLYQVDFGPKYGGNLGSVVKCREWEKPTQIDVKWDEIVEIRPDGEAEVFDLTVPGLHNFVANEIVVHNSIEQDADLVIMLYRDEYYSPDTPDQGIAEVIITKHRNGPTGTIKLLFDPQFTKFRNLAIRGNREQATGNR
ncbi:replicative DNA helicase, partial [Okeania sp. SIO1H5]